MTNVLLAIDGPLYGKAIENFVVNYRWPEDVNFKLIYYIEPLRGLDAWPEVRIDLECVDEERRCLEELAERIKKALPAAITCCEICHGFPKDEIIAEAIRWPAEMIVMGSHGRHGLQRFLMGSVSLSVTTNAPCSVVIIRLPKTVEQASVLSSHFNQSQNLTSDLKTPTK